MHYHQDIVQAVRENEAFRRVVATAEHAQLVFMSLKPGEEIGLETHTLDQIIVIVDGSGESILDGTVAAIAPNHCVYVPAGIAHNFKNTGSAPLKLWTVYAPPEHKDGTVHQTKAEAEADEHDHAS